MISGVADLLRSVLNLARIIAFNHTRPTMRAILLLACLVFLAPVAGAADETHPKTANVEQRLRETDLAIAFSQYEKVQMAAFEARLQLSLSATKADLPEQEVKHQRESMERRIKILEELAADLRAQILRLGREPSAGKAK